MPVARWPSGPVWISGSRSGMPALPSKQTLGVVIESAGDQTVEQLLGGVVGEHLERRKLAVAVLGIVAAGLVEVDLADVRGVDRLIPALHAARSS